MTKAELAELVEQEFINDQLRLWEQREQQNEAEGGD